MTAALTVELQQSRRRRLARARAPVLVLFAAVILSWPMMLNRQPFFLSDTTTYVRGADAAVYRLTGITTSWTQRFFERFGTSEEGHPGWPHARAKAPAGAKAVVLAGRSIYYGALLYAAYAVGDLRVAAFVQALLAATCLYLTMGRFVRESRRRNRDFIIAALVLSVASPLAYFTGYLVPDVFTGFALLAAAHLLTTEPALSRRGAIFWFAILCVGLLMHSANVLILGIVLLVVIAGRLVWRRPNSAGMALVGVALVVAIGGEILFDFGVERLTGDLPVRPPFLTARLIADGPAKAYLRESCPKSDFLLCRYTPRFNGNSDTLLWSASDKDGIFTALPPDEQRRIAAEQGRLVRETVVHKPLDVIWTTASAVRRQALAWGLPEFNLSWADRGDLRDKLPPYVLGSLDGSLAFRNEMPVRLVELLTIVAALLSLAIVAPRAVRRSADRDLSPFIAVIFLGLAADVFVCGAISTPHDRYLMRVAWLLPLVSYLVLAGRNRPSRALRQPRLE